MSWNPALSILAFILLAAGAGSFGALFQPGEWYQALSKPVWTPPNWLFSPVWTALYLLIALAGWLVWRETGFGLVLAIWVGQLVLNAGWSWIMFSQYQIGWALADIELLLLAIIAFMVAAWPVSPTASWLFVPYLIWVTFAGALNFAVWRLNGL